MNRAVALACFATVVATLPSCIEPRASRCENFICPEGSICSPQGDSCVLPGQVESCANAADGDSCSYQGVGDGRCFDGLCLPRGCGNGQLESGEKCDDNNNANGDGCSADCRSNETCGNGVIDEYTGESCDDGNNDDGDGCQGACVTPTCGDGIVDTHYNESCDDGAGNSNASDATCRPNCQPQRCGDGVLDSGELCDDGNIRSGDGCSFDCLSDETCGNGYVDLQAGEQCDDDSQLCRADCTTALCGDGIVDPYVFEICDDGVLNSDEPGAGCRTNCRPRSCGDGIEDTDFGEECDDGNSQPGDGCTAACIIERCGNGIIDVEWAGGTYLPSESCDDGENGLNNDGCTTGCAIERPTWRQRSLSLPSPRAKHSMAYDARRGKTVLYGGVSYSDGDGTLEYDDTWERDAASGNWRSIPIVGYRPPPRHSAAMVYAAARGTVLMFGGNNAGPLGDTWEYDGASATWVQVAAGGEGPPPRYDHALAYDAARDKVVLFGGYDTGALNDTWEYDRASATWSRIEVSGSLPPARARHAMVYDATRSKVVMFGGSAGTLYSAATWEYDGATSQWNEVVVGGASPAGRASHAMVYDTLRRKVVMSAGVYYDPVAAATTYLDDTWEYDGATATWSQPVVASSTPTARDGHAMVYDVVNGTTLLFGGWGTWPEFFGDTWEYDGTSATWTEPTNVDSAPTYRYGHAMTYDAARGRAVLFGGYHYVGMDIERFGDTWEYEPAKEVWTQVYVASEAPSPRFSHAMTYDPARRKTVLFGGDAGEYDGETWEYDGVTSTWTRVAISGPSPSARIGHSMVYDPVRNKILLFGGRDIATGVTAEAWEFDGAMATWTLVAVTGGTPRGRYNHAMAYDAHRQKTVVVGGIVYDGIAHKVADTWEYDSTSSSWTQIEADGSAPLPRYDHAIVYDAQRKTSVLLAEQSGTSSDRRLWEYDGTTSTWRQVATDEVTPVATADHAMTYDAVTGSVLLFGSGETWTFQYVTGDMHEACHLGFDVDKDGLVGCADPDCWSFCTPNCPPQSTPSWPADCPLTEPRCGDGTCNTYLESPRLCPDDCGAPAAMCGDSHCDAGEGITSCPGDCTL